MLPQNADSPLLKMRRRVSEFTDRYLMTQVVDPDLVSLETLPVKFHY